MSDAEAFERCIFAGGVAVFPSDTVYGLACDPTSPEAVTRLYGLKRRALGKPFTGAWGSAATSLAMRSGEDPNTASISTYSSGK